MINEIWNHICTPNGLLQFIMAVVAVIGFVVLIKRYKIAYDKPKIKILDSFATPGNFPSKIIINISNPSNFENQITEFELMSNQSFRSCKTVEQKELNIPLPATSKISAEIPLDFVLVEGIRGCNAILVITDLKGSKIKKRFKFMPSRAMTVKKLKKP